MSAQGDSAPVGPDMRGLTSERVSVVILDPDHLALLPGPPRGDCRLAYLAIGCTSATQLLLLPFIFGYYC